MYLPPAADAIPDDVSPDMIDRIDQIIAANRGQLNALIPVLQQVQEVAGYLPVSLQQRIAQGMGVPGSDVFGVTTFYSFFSMEPRGRNVIKVCLGTACFVQGGNEALGRIKTHTGLKEGETGEDRRFTLEVVRCVGACGLAPVTVINEDTHRKLTADRVTEVLEQYE
ncbi:MAG: NAD(P)H-dependent oxidoreductase subunit E [Proteobacteria bacterium]|nr:NAD(P)H-dependent oxidoreductase subunit E [Pseudomonadota bacterium]MBU1740573.1 NAD(P)H-dependent oxidoreductase subunit E [Pseudomonadota bacterium]